MSRKIQIRVHIDTSDGHEQKEIINTIRAFNAVQNLVWLKIMHSGIQHMISSQQQTISNEEMQKLARNLTEPVIYIVDKAFEEEGFSHSYDFCSFITIHNWSREYAPPSLTAYLMFLLLRVLLSQQAALRNRSMLNPMIHEEATGCMNDLCKDRKQIRISMTAGFICPDCKQAYRRYGVDEKQLAEAEKILSQVRQETVGKQPIDYRVIDAGKKVFIAHGHNEEIRRMVESYIRSHGLTPVVLKEEARNGLDTIFHQLYENSNVGCALLLFTGDDIGCPKDTRRARKRARQNVIFEAGYFIGALGPEKVLMMRERNLDMPSDLDGCRYIDLDTEGAWKEQLLEDFQALGLVEDEE